MHFRRSEFSAQLWFPWTLIFMMKQSLLPNGMACRFSTHSWSHLPSIADAMFWSKDMQDGMIIEDRLQIIDPFCLP
jgi:hypothetical protein